MKNLPTRWPSQEQTLKDNKVNKPNNEHISIFTIGFTQKKASSFFEILKKSSVKKLVDTRLNNTSQLSGFAKKDDLAYFLKKLAAIDYEHRTELSPTKDILDNYKNKKISWDNYEKRFAELLRQRKIENLFQPQELDGACLLCSEHTAEHCHRRLVAEYLKQKWKNVKIQHL